MLVRRASSTTASWGRVRTPASPSGSTRCETELHAKASTPPSSVPSSSRRSMRPMLLESRAMPPAARLDVRGLLCPLPVLRTARRVAGLAPGEELEVVGDDPLLRLDLAAWCAREGHELLAIEDRDGALHCRLRVSLAGGGRG